MHMMNHIKKRHRQELSDVDVDLFRQAEECVRLAESISNWYNPLGLKEENGFPRDPKEKLFYGNHKIPWETAEGVKPGYIMIHRDSCSHMSHVTVERGADVYHYAYGDLEEVYLWAIKRSAMTGLPIYHCTKCKPPMTSPFPKNIEAQIRRRTVIEIR